MSHSIASQQEAIATAQSTAEMCQSSTLFVLIFGDQRVSNRIAGVTS